MLWAERKRAVPIVEETDPEENVDENDEGVDLLLVALLCCVGMYVHSFCSVPSMSDVFLRPDEKAKQQANREEQHAALVTLRSEDSCMHATHAYIYYDQGNTKDSLVFLKKALECDKRSGAAHRLWGECEWGVMSMSGLTLYVRFYN